MQSASQWGGHYPTQPNSPPSQQQTQSQQPTGKPVYARYRAQQSMYFGTLQVTLGLLSGVFNICGVVIHKVLISRYPLNPYHYGNVVYFFWYGFWFAPLYILAGAFGIVAGKRRTKCPVVAHLVLSIVAAVFGFGHIILSSVSVNIDRNPVAYDREESGAVIEVEISSWQWPYYQGSLAVSAMMLIVALIEVGIAIWSSCLGCLVVCCGPPPRVPGAVSGNPMVYHPTATAPLVMGGPTQAGPSPYPVAATQAGPSPYPVAASAYRPQPTPDYRPVATAPPPSYDEVKKQPML